MRSLWRIRSANYRPRRIDLSVFDRRRVPLREPFSGLSHLAGAVAAIAGLVYLMALAGGRPAHTAAFAIYGLSLLGMYLCSAFYHLLPASGETQVKLRKADHIAIYLLIAGTYVPICVLALQGPWGTTMVAVEGALAVVGIVATIRFKGGPSWLRATLYVAMGWLAAVAIGPLRQSLPHAAIQWLFAGGILFTVGAVVYSADRPHLIPGKFSAHDLWHLFVIAGTACHYVLVCVYLR